MVDAGTSFGLGTFAVDGRSFAAIVVDETRVVPLAALHPTLDGLTVLDVLDRWTDAWPVLREAAASARDSDQAYDLASVTVLAPHRPPQILQAGANLCIGKGLAGGLSAILSKLADAHFKTREALSTRDVPLA